MDKAIQIMLSTVVMLCSAQLNGAASIGMINTVNMIEDQLKMIKKVLDNEAG